MPAACFFVATLMLLKRLAARHTGAKRLIFHTALAWQQGTATYAFISSLE